jgi:hypothetical protein
LSDILIVGEKKRNIFPTYLPIGYIAESERENKQYFILSPLPYSFKINYKTIYYLE